MFLLNSRRAFLCGLHRGALLPKLRAILPSSLTRILPCVQILTPPTCSVCGTGTLRYNSSFSCRREITRFPYSFFGPWQLRPCEAYSLRLILVASTQLTITVLELSFRVTASFFSVRAGISTCYPSLTTFVLGLGPDLPGWMNLPRKPWAFDGHVFSHASRYHTGILFCIVH